eukprot:SAG31_NODE_960_length_10753_cov_7.843064_2_plen_115_part_00
MQPAAGELRPPQMAPVGSNWRRSAAEQCAAHMQLDTGPGEETGKMPPGTNTASEPIAVFQMDVEAKGCVSRSRHGVFGTVAPVPPATAVASKYTRAALEQVMLSRDALFDFGSY